MFKTYQEAIEDTKTLPDTNLCTWCSKYTKDCRYTMTSINIKGCYYRLICKSCYDTTVLQSCNRIEQ